VFAGSAYAAGGFPISFPIPIGQGETRPSHLSDAHYPLEIVKICAMPPEEAPRSIDLNRTRDCIAGNTVQADCLQIPLRRWCDGYARSAANDCRSLLISDPESDATALRATNARWSCPGSNLVPPDGGNGHASATLSLGPQNALVQRLPFLSAARPASAAAPRKNLRRFILVGPSYASYMWEDAMKDLFSSAHPILPSLNFEKTIAFYQKLGFVLSSRYDNYLIMHRDGIELHFWPCTDRHIAENTGCYFRSPDVDALHAGLVAKGVRAAPPQDQSWNMREFYLIDPSGNLLRIGSARPKSDQS
jgi:catechol 2,3-dioxygenase-like lactoylglutathione lyase family enzyme